MLKGIIIIIEILFVVFRVRIKNYNRTIIQYINRDNYSERYRNKFVVIFYMLTFEKRSNRTCCGQEKRRLTRNEKCEICRSRP